MKVVNLRRYPSYFITQHGEVFKIVSGKEVRVPAYYNDYKLYVTVDNNQKELIYLMIEAFEIDYKPSDRLKFKVTQKTLSINIHSIKITPLNHKGVNLNDDVYSVVDKYECNLKASAANSRFEDKITGYEIASVIKFQAFNCFYCGKNIDHNNWQVDHFHPKTHRGKNIIKNIVACCDRCNRMKNTMDGNEFISIARRIVKHNINSEIHQNGK